MAVLLGLVAGLPLCSFGQGTAPQPPPAQAAGPPALTLNQAVSAALASDPAARAAVQQLAQAQARLGQVQAQRRSSITFNSTVSGSNASVIQPPPSSETFGTLQNTLTVPLPIGQRGRYTVRQADQQLSAAQAQYQAARLALAGQVTAAYYDLLRKQALMAMAVAQQTLNDVTGRPIDALPRIADITGPPPVLPYTLVQARALAVQRSADVRAADATVRADEAALEAARLYREPAVSPQAIDIRSNDQTSFSRQDTLQASLTAPLSEGGLGREQVREAALAARGIAQLTYDKTILGYQNGLFPIINVLTAQNALAQACIAYVQALYDAASSESALEAAVSGGTVGNSAAPGTGTAPGNGGTPSAKPTGAGGTSPAGAGNPGTSPSGTSPTGPGAGGATNGGRGGL